jgi:hypothetical protein
VSGRFARGRLVPSRALPGARCYPPTVTRPHASAPGRPTRHLLPLAAFAAVLIAACGGAQETGPPSGSLDPITSVAPSADPPSEEPASGEPASLDPESAPPSTTPSAPAEASTDVEGPAGDCTGTDENRMFYGSVAAAVDWTVYCPVLPSGWFVEAGQYRLAGGGQMAIAYRGPGGARFSLDQGVWCTDGSGCVPAGSEIGPTAFGDRTGSLIATADGSYAIGVDAGSTVSWLLTGEGLDEATARTFGAALIAVDD